MMNVNVLMRVVTMFHVCCGGDKQRYVLVWCAGNDKGDVLMGYGVTLLWCRPLPLLNVCHLLVVVACDVVT